MEKTAFIWTKLRFSLDSPFGRRYNNGKIEYSVTRACYYMESFFGKDTQCSDTVSDRFLRVNNCGYYRDISVDMLLKRPKGRHDFQYIYIDKGKGNFEFGDKLQTVSAGSAVIYKPREKQVYYFDSSSRADFYWVHFSGTGAEDILRELGLHNGIFKTGEMFRVREAVKKMVGILRTEGRSAEIHAAGILAELLSETEECLHLGRRRMRKVIDAMQSDGAAGKSNAEYARMCGLSEYHFIRSFKEETGTTPHKYRIKLIIEKAADLLLKTDINISEAARLLGFDDTLYFSRVFKKETGMSPAEFRTANSR